MKMHVNKLPALCAICLLSSAHLAAQETVVQYLSGTDNTHTVPWDFMCTKGRNAGKWSTIPVPSCWEMQGFGSYNYYRDTMNPDEKGLYKHWFTVNESLASKKVFLVFEGSMTETEVKINGQLAGPVHIGSFYEFKYDITRLVRSDTANLLEVDVKKKSSDSSVNRAERKVDFWLFGGIFRPVYLKIVPDTYIDRVAIDARASGDFNMHVYGNVLPSQTMEAQVYDETGSAVDQPFHAPGSDTVLTHHFDHINLWNPEQPHLYNIVVRIREGEKIVHSIRQRFGFRTAELREKDGFYVNGKKVIFKGVCRHSEWPETGRTLNRNIHLLDIGLIKDMNMNAVRMSHYPPDKEFLDLCDSLGLFVLDELTGWQAAYDTAIGRKLVKELVVRDVNHPCIVLWDNGNEGGWNRALDGDFAWYDPQRRHVIHPWERFNGTNTKHYPNFAYVQHEVANANEVFFPTEFMHGLFDGGQGAGLEDFWNEMMKHPHAAGGFLWSFHDEGLVREDKHDSIDVAGNNAPDGIVGPHREKEGSYYTIKTLWSPIFIDTRQPFRDLHGRIPVENRYLYTDLQECHFEWQQVAFPGPEKNFTKSLVLASGMNKTTSIPPGEKGLLNIPATINKQADAFYLRAFNAKGDTICIWSWALKKPAEKITGATTVRKMSLGHSEDLQSLTVSCDGISYRFDKHTGFLLEVVQGRKHISLHGGPALATGTMTMDTLRHDSRSGTYIVEPVYSNDSLRVKWTFRSGALPQMDYSYRTPDTANFMGICFRYPEEMIAGMKWLGRGPYHVWKNRLQGQQFGVWQKKYNNTVTGESWNYPEFKGWHANMYWVRLQNAQSDFTVLTDQDNIFLQMLRPQKPHAATNNNTSPAFADGDIGFMHAISPIGTKFQSPDVLGPQSRKNTRQGSVPLKGRLYFDFR